MNCSHAEYIMKVLIYGNNTYLQNKCDLSKSENHDCYHCKLQQNHLHVYNFSDN